MNGGFDRKAVVAPLQKDLRRGDDPETGFPFDHTKRYIDNAQGLSAADKKKIFEGNALKVYSRLKPKIASRL